MPTVRLRQRGVQFASAPSTQQGRCAACMIGRTVPYHQRARRFANARSSMGLTFPSTPVRSAPRTTMGKGACLIDRAHDGSLPTSPTAKIRQPEARGRRLRSVAHHRHDETQNPRPNTRHPRTNTHNPRPEGHRPGIQREVPVLPVAGARFTGYSN
jgi:hypothetical protein